MRFVREIAAGGRSVARRRSRRGFTLVELLTVVGIIILATAMALPGITQFLKGQKLAQAGRLIQSAFSEARRAAITQRSRHWVFIGRMANDSGTNSYAIKHFREGKGWEPSQIVLPSSIHFVFDGQGTLDVPIDPPTFPTGGLVTAHSGIRVQDWSNGSPLEGDANYTALFDPATKTINNGVAAFEFRKDGTIRVIGGAIDVPPPTTPDLYDLNTPLDTIAATTPADFILKQIGEPSKRCFIDVDRNTGRVRMRVIETQTQG